MGSNPAGDAIPLSESLACTEIPQETPLFQGVKLQSDIFTAHRTLGYEPMRLYLKDNRGDAHDARLTVTSSCLGHLPGFSHFNLENATKMPSRPTAARKRRFLLEIRRFANARLHCVIFLHRAYMCFFLQTG